MCDKSISHERKVQAYLKPKNHNLFEGFVKANQISESAAMNIIVKDYFSRQSDSDKMSYLKKK